MVFGKENLVSVALAPLNYKEIRRFHSKKYCGAEQLPICAEAARETNEVCN